MDVGQIVLVLVAVSLGFFAKGVTGIGGPILAVPVLASMMGVEFAVVVIATPTVYANSWLLWNSRDAATEVGWFLWPMVTAGAVGTVMGALVLANVDDRVMSLVVAGLILVYVAWYLVNREFRLDRKWARRLSAPTGLVGGWLVGATGIAAPAIATYVHALGLGRSGFIFAVSVPFWTLGIVQIISYASLGAYDQERVISGLVAVIPLLVVLPIAERVRERLSRRAFHVAILVILTFSAVRLLSSAMI